ncbi:tRNA threonylcarbamoyladenosine dehydratase [Gammaproteobacteria bacterium]|nr:tRNA threonylcarbamoyladenosine dehydratase [Gammaproteobacteria bacterium]
MSNPPIPRRFAAAARLYGESGWQRIAAAHVVVIGVGGVGSWTVEALARSGVGELTLIDMDVVSESNINRQLPALDDTLGALKIEVLRDRIAAIAPDCQVNAIDDFISADNIDDRVTASADIVVDCIDSFRIKAALIATLRRRKQKVITVGGAGGMIDPSRLHIVDLSRAEQDALLARLRKTLRQDYDFPRNLKRRFAVPAVCSSELPRFDDGQGGITRQKKGAAGLNCAGGLGSSVAVTASAGLLAASWVLGELVREA